MRLAPIVTEKMIKTIIKHLEGQGLQLADRQKTAGLIDMVIKGDVEEEREIEEEALKLLKQHKASLGASIDESKALRMIMKKLADERGFNL